MIFQDESPVFHNLQEMYSLIHAQEVFLYKSRFFIGLQSHWKGRSQSR